MQIAVERDALAMALTAVNARTCGKIKIPILACVLLEASNSRLRVFTHSGDACCSFEIAAEIKQPGAIAIDADRLAAIIGGFAKGAQTAISANATEAEIKSGRSRYRFSILAPADMPPPLASDGAVEFSIPSSDFLFLFDTPQIAMCNQVTRRHLNGIYLHATKRGLASCATDGHNLIRVQTDLKVPPFDPIILPRERIAELLTGMDEKDSVKIEACQRLFSLVVGERRYTTKLIDGMFPDYPAVVPPANAHEIIVARIDLLGAVQRLCAHLGDHNAVTLTWGNGAPMLTLAPHAHDAALEEIDSSGGEIPPGQFITSARRIVDLMSVMPHDEVKIIFTSPTKPLRIEGANNDDVLQLIMPLDFGRPVEQAA